MSNLEAIITLQERQKPPVDIRKNKAAANGDPEIQAMNDEADLLARIQADTGEQGHVSGDYIAFQSCPVCGHRDCFRFYPSTNSWACFSASNSSSYEGGRFTEYMKAAHGCSDAEAVKALREATGHPYTSMASSDAGGEDAGKLKLPRWSSVRALNPPTRKPVLIDGVLRLGHVGMLAGKGKSAKSWAAIRLAITVATGGEWFGHEIKRTGRVLYLDPEIDKRSLDNRFAVVCDAMIADKSAVDKCIDKWSLRGVPDATIDNVIHDLGQLCNPGDYALVVIDSSSWFVDGDENSAVDVHAFFAGALRVAATTGAGVMLVHHFGKANDGDRSAGDRARGSSVWLDAPDATLFLTEIFPPSGEPSDYLAEGERAFRLESGGLREFPPMEPSNLIFAHPLHRLDSEGVTDGWKPRSGQRGGGKQTAELNKARGEANQARAELNLISCLYANGEQEIRMADAPGIAGCSRNALEAYLGRSEYLTIRKDGARKWFVVPKNPPKPQTLQMGEG